MLLVYSDITSSRLQYTCDFIFKEQFGLDYKITIDSESFRNHAGAKINYSNSRMEDAYTIKSQSLLFEQDIKEQTINCVDLNNYKAFFKTSDSDFPFDIFAAIFYLLSRYEEYLPHEKDMYGRFAHENSISFKEGFLNKPVINIWLTDFSSSLKKIFPALTFKTKTFNFLPTYDIDIAYSFKHKGFIRNLGGFIKSPSLERLAVLAGLKKDPFDSFDFMDKLHTEFNLNPVYFFLVATSGSLYDKNISPYSNAMWQLIKRHAKKYRSGLHPSWRSNNNFSILLKEKKILETAGKMEVNISRQHYLKMSMPQTYQELIKAGIEADYTMGYGSINGFRASVASTFYWYDLTTEKTTSLQLYPFCYMDANSFYEQDLDAGQALEELQYYLNECKKVNGFFISIFHNNFLGTDKQFTGWKEMYTKFISQVQG
ncbi:MAG: polysaccharide deacetylase family protein [Ferruginibacter sp.]|nr:polysaccharide deacetylase family protein [Ferruginibacter sp.]